MEAGRCKMITGEGEEERGYEVRGRYVRGEEGRGKGRKE